MLAVGEPLGGVAAGFDDAGQLALLLCGEEGDLADLVQVQTNRITHGGSCNLNYPVVIPFPPSELRAT